MHSGAVGCAHVTVRALENRRPVPPQDPFAVSCASALDRACAHHAPLFMKLERLLITPGGVLALLHPTSPDADEFRTYTLGHELGPNAYREGILKPPRSLVRVPAPLPRPHRAPQRSRGLEPPTTRSDHMDLPRCSAVYLRNHYHGDAPPHPPHGRVRAGDLTALL